MFKRIYLIDDDDISRFVNRKFLELRGIAEQIELFASGAAALNQLHTHAINPDGVPDLILLDLVMPGLGGWEFLRNFAALKPSLCAPVRMLMLSSSVNPNDIELSLELGAEQFISKPLSDHNLPQILRTEANAALLQPNPAFAHPQAGFTSPTAH